MTYPTAVALLMALAAGQIPRDEVSIPEAARGFVTAGTRPIAFEKADLNRDGRPDAVLVLEPLVKDGEDPYAERPRTLLVLVGEPDGTYRQAARNTKVVYCAACGGVMGDPFQSVSVEAGRFTVINAGGSNWRWDAFYTFGYSRRDDTWQLVRVQEGRSHTSDPGKETTTVSTPPKHFGKIDLADFDPDHWKNVGPR